jgi:hypothetical protein
LESLSDTKWKNQEQRPGFAQTLSTGSENRYTFSPRAQSPAGTASRNGADPDEGEQSALDRFDSLAVTVNQSSRSQTNDAQPGAAVRLRETPSQLEVPRQPSTSSVQRNSVQLSDESPSFKEQTAYKAIQCLFSRASHLIRESSELNGIIFVDASLQDIAIKENRQSVVTRPNTPRYGDFTYSETSHNREMSISIKRNSSITTESTELPSLTRQGFNIQVEAAATGDIDSAPTCRLLGCSLNTDSGRGDAAPSSRHLAVPQSTLRGLLHRYPNGHVFLFSTDGSLLDDKVMHATTRRMSSSSAHTRSKDKSTFEKEKEQLRAYQLLHICPGARGIIFFPLWDPQRDQVSMALGTINLFLPLNYFKSVK